MHISEGILKSPSLVAGYAVALPVLAYTFRSLNTENIIKTAAFSALFLVVSFIHIPLGPSSIHLLFIGVLGALLGRACFVAIFIALFIQALMFGFGGLYVLGVNSSIMGLSALFSAYVFKLSLKSSFFLRNIIYFLTGFLGVFMASILLLFTMWANDLLAAGVSVLIGNIALMIVEGLISFFILNYLERIKKL